VVGEDLSAELLVKADGGDVHSGKINFTIMRNVPLGTDVQTDSILLELFPAEATLPSDCKSSDEDPSRHICLQGAPIPAGGTWPIEIRFSATNEKYYVTGKINDVDISEINDAMCAGYCILPDYPPRLKCSAT
jgi:hypothetical protein